VKPVRIKVCGITRESDALVADELAVDAVGFVFVEKSKRVVTIARAAELSAVLGPFVQRVGLFLDDEASLVNQALAAIPNLMPQFHGQESPEFCDQFERPYLKAIGMASGLPSQETLDAYAGCQGFLFDSNAPGALGGTGHTFDWSSLKSVRPDARAGRHLILAGGLAPDNIEQAIREVQPDAVDVSSGVEESPGIKDPALMREFVGRAKAVSASPV